MRSQSPNTDKKGKEGRKIDYIDDLDVSQEKNKKIVKKKKMEKKKKSRRRDNIDPNSEVNVVDSNTNSNSGKIGQKNSSKKNKFLRKNNEKGGNNIGSLKTSSSKKDQKPYSRAQNRQSNRPRPRKIDKYPNIYRKGLWKYSRHPNLFFELTFWFGMAIGGLNDLRSSFFGFVGFGVLFMILRFGTIPITEEYMHNSRPNYEDFCKGTNMLLPIRVCFCFNRGNSQKSNSNGENVN